MTYNTLFLCTGNSARSILAESILRKIGAGRFNSFSAGSHPAGQVNPYALDALDRADYPTNGFRSKSWDEFADPKGPAMDFVFTVCDNAAGEVCPIWPGHPMTAHWGVPDPVVVKGDSEASVMAFYRALILLEHRIKLFVALNPKALDRLSLKRKLEDIGKAGTEPQRA